MVKFKNNQQANSEQALRSQLRRIEDLLKTLVKIQLRDIVKSELDQSDMKNLYVLTGSYTIRDIEKKTGLSKATISRTWQKWEQFGLLIKDGKTYRKVL
jgi:uncharacterized protein YerC